ncbi:hypothetical protein HK097_006001 [Rhizophlyctis rosea]|uniref:Uncharacterized protein n=1 Tax=Rhizophlyctis rosea TaxID=64517 RepID=A0AAD5X299_9FUNG|nr:hypothetical protein HK097_006001 [Rhizophlyctis rosea]
MASAGVGIGTHVPVFFKNVFPGPDLQIQVLPGAQDGSYIDGCPGITPFTIRAIIRVTNTNKSKHRTVQAVKVHFCGSTIVSYQGVGEIPGLGNVGRAHAEHIENKVDLLEEVVVGVGSVPRGTSLAPKEIRDFHYAFLVPSPSQGGPTYMPHSMVKPYGHGDAFTNYSIHVRVFNPKTSIFSSGPEVTADGTRIPFIWHDHDSLGDILRIQDLETKPGWQNNIPIHLPTSATTLPGDCPIRLDLNFAHGLTFDIDGNIDLTYRIAAKSGVQGIVIKGLVMKIAQKIVYMGQGQTTGHQLPYQIFRWQSPPLSTLDFFKRNIASVPLKQWIEADFPAILPTRCKEGEDKYFLVHHVLDVTVLLGGAKDVHIQAPCTVVPWKRKDMLDFIQTNPVVVREVVQGLAPEYEADVPAYENAPAYADAADR